MLRGDRSYELLAWALANGCPLKADGTDLPPLTVPHGTVLAFGAFRHLKELKMLVLPDSLEHISGHAFHGCTGLTLPTALISIDTNAFADCKGLTRLTLSDSLEHIGSSAFLGCRGLSVLTLPAKVTTIYDYAFRDCTGLRPLRSPTR
jgi:hypothetical protein